MKPKSKYPYCMKHSRLLTKSIHTQLYARTHLNDWMFLSADLSQIEIGTPNLKLITIMKELGLNFVLKGFKNKIEYLKFDKIRIKLGMATSMLLFSFVDSKSSYNIIMNFLENNTLPDKNEMLSIMDKNNFVDVKSDKGLKTVHDRNKWKKRQEKYSYILWNQVFNLIKQGRITHLT